MVRTGLEEAGRFRYKPQSILPRILRQTLVTLDPTLEPSRCDSVSPSPRSSSCSSPSGPTANPTAQWAAQQIVEAFPYDQGPRFLLRDRDGIYGKDFRDRVEHMGIEQVLIAPRAPWQNPYVERLIGSIRRECLDHMIVFDEEHLRRILTEYFAYYHKARLHLSLERNSPFPRPVCPPAQGKVVANAYLGGLHHCYTRAA